jgi:hypothetical protein
VSDNTFGVYDSSDPVAVDNAAKEKVRRDRQDDETIRVWMSHPNGRELLFRYIFEICHMGVSYLATDDTGRSDTHRTYCDLGERNMGAYLDERLRRHPELYMKMLQEAETDRDLRNSRLLKQNEKKEERDGE